MGGFYGSTQIRTGDRDVVLAAVDEVSSALRIRCLVGPALGNWVGVYPEHGGQDPAVGAALASKLAGDVFHVLVHDDDVFCYWYWRDGQLRDQYNSDPDYLNSKDDAPPSGADHKTAGGDPATYAHLLDGRAGQVAALLASDDVTFEIERLNRFGKLLGIRNLGTAYDYLKAGETEGVTGVKKFVEVPRVAAASKRAEAAARRATLKREKAALRAEGLLLAETEQSTRGWSIHPAGDGVVLQLTGHGSADYEHRWLPSLPAEPEPVPWEGRAYVVTSEGRRLFVRRVDGDYVVEIPEFRSAWSVPDHGTKFRFSAGGDWLGISDDKQVRVYSAADGRLAGTAATAFLRVPVHHLAVHPSGAWVALVSGSLAIGRVADDPAWRFYYPGGRVEPPQWVLELPPPDPATVAAEMDAAMEQTLKRFKVNDRSPQAAQFRERLLAEWAQQKARAVEAARNPVRPAPEPSSAESVQDLGWTADGSLLWLATQFGLRVYDWPAVRDATTAGDLPPPVAAHDTFTTDEWGNKLDSWVHAVVEDRVGRALVFGGAAGILWRMDFSRGTVRELLRVPELPHVTRAVLSPDGRHLGVASMPRFADRHANPAKQRRVWSVWSYPELVERSEA